MNTTPKYTFHNLPRRYTRSDYSDVSKRIAKRYKNLNGLISIYNWGNPSCPGISDIDLVLVFENNAPPLPLVFRSFYFLESSQRYLVRHPFMYCDKPTFRMLRYIYPQTDFSLIYGQKLSLDSVAKSEETDVKIALLNDIVIRHYPRDFLIQQMTKKINVRDTLLRLNSLKYTVQIFSEISGTKNNAWDDFTAQVAALRTSWFAKPNFKELTALHRQAVTMTLEIIEVYRKFLVAKKIITLKPQKSFEYHGNKNKTQFVPQWNKDTALQAMEQSVKNGAYRSILPLELGADLLVYSAQKGPISSYIKKNLSARGITAKTSHEKILQKRISLLNSQALLANKLRHSEFPAFFDFGYRQGAGLNNKILRVIDRLRF